MQGASSSITNGKPLDTAALLSVLQGYPSTSEVKYLIDEALDKFTLRRLRPLVKDIVGESPGVVADATTAALEDGDGGGDGGSSPSQARAVSAGRAGGTPDAKKTSAAAAWAVDVDWIAMVVRSQLEGDLLLQMQSQVRAEVDRQVREAMAAAAAVRLPAHSSSSSSTAAAAASSSSAVHSPRPVSPQLATGSPPPGARPPLPLPPRSPSPQRGAAPPERAVTDDGSDARAAPLFRGLEDDDDAENEEVEEEQQGGTAGGDESDGGEGPASSPDGKANNAATPTASNNINSASPADEDAGRRQRERILGAIRDVERHVSGLQRQVNELAHQHRLGQQRAATFFAAVLGHEMGGSGMGGSCGAGADQSGLLLTAPPSAERSGSPGSPGKHHPHNQPQPQQGSGNSYSVFYASLLAALDGRDLTLVRAMAREAAAALGPPASEEDHSGSKEEVEEGELALSEVMAVSPSSTAARSAPVSELRRAFDTAEEGRARPVVPMLAVLVAAEGEREGDAGGAARTAGTGRDVTATPLTTADSTPTATTPAAIPPPPPPASIVESSGGRGGATVPPPPPSLQTSRSPGEARRPVASAARQLARVLDGGTGSSPRSGGPSVSGAEVGVAVVVPPMELLLTPERPPAHASASADASPTAADRSPPLITAALQQRQKHPYNHQPQPQQQQQQPPSRSVSASVSLASASSLSLDAAALYEQARPRATTANASRSGSSSTGMGMGAGGAPTRHPRISPQRQEHSPVRAYLSSTAAGSHRPRGSGSGSTALQLTDPQTTTPVSRRTQQQQGPADITLGIDAIDLPAGVLPSSLGLRGGIRVLAVGRGGLAERSGVAAGDVVIAVAGAVVETCAQLQQAMRRCARHEAVRLDLYRHAVQLVFTITLDL